MPASIDNLREWLTAAGTLGAVLVAVSAQILSQWFRRARLCIEYKPRPPFHRIEKGDGTRVLWIRLKVLNRGPAAAQDCEVRLEEVVLDGRECNFDPSPIPWASLKSISNRDGEDSIIVSEYRPIDIAKQRYEYIELAFRQEDDPYFGFAVDEMLARGRGIQLRYPAGRYSFTISVFSTNCRQPLNWSRSIIVGEDWTDVTIGRRKGDLMGCLQSSITRER